MEDKDDFLKYVKNCNPKPEPECKELKKTDVIEGIKTYIVDDRQPEVITVDEAMPEEYAIAAWFRWDARYEKQAPWHLMFRLTINDKEGNKNAETLGDRVLSAWVG
jgi:hypothetical protein